MDYSQGVHGHKLPEPTDSGLADPLSLAQKGWTQSFLEGTLLNVVAPISEEGGELKGVAILVTLPTDHIHVATRNQTRLVMAVSGGVFLFVSVIAIFGAKTISRPIAHLTQMTHGVWLVTSIKDSRSRAKMKLASWQPRSIR